MSNEIISGREFARRIGVSEGYVRRMITDGVITPAAVVIERGKKGLIWEQAKKDWDTNYSPTRELKPSQIRKSSKAKPPEEQEADADVVPPEPPASRNPGTLPDGRKSKSELDRLRLEVKLQREALELKKAKKELVEVRDVYRALFEFGQELLKDLMVIPDKVTDLMRAAPNRSEAHRVLYTELYKLAEHYSGVQDDDLNLKR